LFILINKQASHSPEKRAKKESDTSNSIAFILLFNSLNPKQELFEHFYQKFKKL